MSGKRVVLLPTPGDPYILGIWYLNWLTWRHMVDMLYIHLNTDCEAFIVEAIRKLFEKDEKVIVEYTPSMVQHGTSLAMMTKRAPPDSCIMFMEDDGYILQPGAVHSSFLLIEEGATDIVASRRTSSSMDLQRAMAKRFGVDISGVGDKGIGFWPCFFFTKREYLMNTDLDFNAKFFAHGEYIKEVDWVVEADNKTDVRCDTFVWASIQLQEAGLTIQELPQYHLNPHWKSDKREQQYAFSPHACWFHAGSLSGSIYGILRNDEGIQLAFTGLNRPKEPEGWTIPCQAHSESERLEYQKRLAFNKLGYSLRGQTVGEQKELLHWGVQYNNAIERVIDQWGLDREDIQNQQKAYSNLLSL